MSKLDVNDHTLSAVDLMFDQDVQQFIKDNYVTCDKSTQMFSVAELTAYIETKKILDPETIREKVYAKLKKLNYPTSFVVSKTEGFVWYFSTRA